MGKKSLAEQNIANFKCQSTDRQTDELMDQWTNPPTHPPTHLPKYLPAYLPACIHACLPVYVLYQYIQNNYFQHLTFCLLRFFFFFIQFTFEVFIHFSLNKTIKTIAIHQKNTSL